MPNISSKKQPPMTGDQHRLLGVAHLYAAEQGQRAGVQAAVTQHFDQLSAQPYQTVKPYWSTGK